MRPGPVSRTTAPRRAAVPRLRHDFLLFAVSPASLTDPARKPDPTSSRQATHRVTSVAGPPHGLAGQRNHFRSFHTTCRAPKHNVLGHSGIVTHAEASVATPILNTVPDDPTSRIDPNGPMAHTRHVPPSRLPAMRGVDRSCRRRRTFLNRKAHSRTQHPSRALSFCLISQTTRSTGLSKRALPHEMHTTSASRPVLRFNRRALVSDGPTRIPVSLIRREGPSGSTAVLRIVAKRHPCSRRPGASHR